MKLMIIIIIYNNTKTILSDAVRVSKIHLSSDFHSNKISLGHPTAKRDPLPQEDLYFIHQQNSILSLPVMGEISKVPTPPIEPSKDDKNTTIQPQTTQKPKEEETKVPTPPVEPQMPKKFKNRQEQYQSQIMPNPEDFYQKDGKMIPNWSKSKNRLPPTVRKIKLVFQIDYRDRIIFDKPIDRTSKYYRPMLPRYTKHYLVANEGQQKLVLLYGDSHAHYTGYRFHKLYEDAKKMNKTNELPTFVAILFQGSSLTPFEDNYNFFINWVEEFKPDRVMLIYFWPTYSIYHGFEDYYRYRNNLQDKFWFENIAYFLGVVKNLTSKGIQVTINNYQPYGDFYWPQKMFDFFGVIQKNVKSFKLSEASASQRHLADYLQTEAKKAGAKVLHYTDHTCYEDVCQVISPMGYPVFKDAGHWAYHSSRHWLTCVDSFIQFEKKSP